MSERAPTDEQLAAEDERRSDVTVQDLLEADLADAATPSRRAAPSPAAGLGDQPDDETAIEGMDLPLRDWRDPEAAS